jgi:hypothetical protein
MTQIIYVPIGGRDWLCLCGDIHHWVDCDLAYQCDCGRMYRKALDFAFSSGHIRHEVDGDQIIRIEDFEL